MTITFLLLFMLFQEPTIALVILQAAGWSPIGTESESVFFVSFTSAFAMTVA